MTSKYDAGAETGVVFRTAKNPYRIVVNLDHAKLNSLIDLMSSPPPKALAIPVLLLDTAGTNGYANIGRHAGEVCFFCPTMSDSDQALGKWFEFLPWPHYP